jgi:hypothetical protein
MGNYHGTAGGRDTMLDGDREREVADEERVRRIVGVASI